MCNPRYKDYLQQKLHGFKLIHEELRRAAPYDAKTQEMELMIKMIETDIELLNKHLEENRPPCKDHSQL